MPSKRQRTECPFKPNAGVGIARGTLYNWRVRYGGMDVSQLKELKALQEENRRQKRVPTAALTADRQSN